jgi:hypothetical protein
VVPSYYFALSGELELLSEAVDINEKGVPNPDKLPIPGALEIK